MLTRPLVSTPLVHADLRRTEFARLDESGVAYLDYAGAALYGESQLDAHVALLARSVFGNPHSEHGSSRASTCTLDAARHRILAFFDAVVDYDVIFTANASAAIKLVAESYPFGPAADCVLAVDNHNSVNGIREYARRAGAHVAYLPLRDDLRLHHPEARLAQAGGTGLFAFPAQSNFSGVQHPLALVRYAQELGYHVLLDAAAFAPSHPLSLRACPADFVVVSFYKMFGYPTGVGALLARHEALAVLSRPWFAGGTVDYVSVQLGRHRLRSRHDAFEDGTANFLDIAALDPGFDFLERAGFDTIRSHTAVLTRALLDGLGGVAHRNGQPAVRIYGPLDGGARGATVAFNLLDADGGVIPYQFVEQRTGAAKVHVRGGCFCNPGAAEAAFGLQSSIMASCFDRLDGDFSIAALQQCVGKPAAVGAIRASPGLANTLDDIRRLVEVVGSFVS